jgi:SOS response regulatory protein OraA/RecX
MRGFSDGEIEKALESLRGQGLLDDASYAMAFAKESLASGRGPKWISAKLRSRGVFVKALGITLGDETASLRALLKKRRVTGAALTDAKERAKIMRFVMGRGYSSAAVTAVFGAFENDEQDSI